MFKNNVCFAVWMAKKKIKTVNIYQALKIRPCVGESDHDVCPRSSDPFYIVLLDTMGHYFLDIQYLTGAG